MSLLDLTNVETQTFQPLKAGKYNTTIVDSKVEPLFSGKGTKLAITIKVLDGDFKGRNIFHSFNIKHENKDAEMIGKSQLKGLMEILGLGAVLDSASQLLGKSFVTVTKIQKDKDTGEEKVRVSYFETASGLTGTDQSSGSDDIPF